MDIKLIAAEILEQEHINEHIISIKYSDKFNNYNANVRYFRMQKQIEFHVSKRWKTVSDEIFSGLLQSLLIRLFKKSNIVTNKSTMNIELYNLFISAERIESDHYLIELYNLLNDKFFSGTMEMPNLVWGNQNFHKLGTYEYASDTVTISSALKDAPQELIAYVVYHELLHKKHKFNIKNGKSFHHTPEFKKDESLFENYQQVDNNLKKFLSRKKRGFSLFH